jgi:hypothetical protein
MGVKNGFLRNSAGELVLWCNGTEVMAFAEASGTPKASFFANDPVDQATHIADAAATNLGDESEHINALLVVYEELGLTADS